VQETDISGAFPHADVDGRVNMLHQGLVSEFNIRLEPCL